MLKTLLNDVRKAYCGSTFIIPAGTRVKLIEGASGTRGHLYAVDDVPLLIKLSGNSHDPHYRYCFVDHSDVIPTEEAMRLDRPVGNMSPQWHFFRSYVTAALWSSTDEDGTPLDQEHDIDDISDDTLQAMARDCAIFYDRFKDLIHCDGAPLANDTDGSTADRESAMAGHDFWLTRCGHGAGFWDGDWPQPAQSILTNACGHGTDFPNIDLYVGDNGEIDA